ncbi:MAG: right-handed parallel beta-helix repeat-containing protein [Vicinamibacteria bacterium]|nr:right-handed parallel beta-helix repeat-containing protein [Vicinamibacteria bacterium]
MKFRRLFLTAVVFAAEIGVFSRPARAAAELELYGTFEAMGVIIELDAGDDPDGDATTQVEYRTGGGAYQPGFPLSRVSSTRHVGSLFWLTPGTTYDVRVTFTDSDGGSLNGTIVTGGGATRAEITIPTPSRSYYVTPTGAGATCSLGIPCALSTAINQAQPGEEVVLRGGSGVYYQGELTLPRSGTAVAPIVFRSYPGETAVFDGGDPATFTWTAQGGGVYRATVNGADAHLVTANGQRLYPYQSLADLQSLRWDLPGFYSNGASVYVHLTDNADPNSTPMVVSRYNYAFYVGRNYIYFSGLTFRHYGRGDYAKAIYFNNASNNLVRNCTFTLNDLGIGLKYASGGNVIEKSTFSDTNFEWPWDAVKDGSRLETGGVGFYSPVTGRGNIIRNNTFHDYFDGFGSCPEATDGQTNETDVYGNLVYNAGDDGLSSDGMCSNVRIWGNTFHDVLAGISLAPVYTGPVYAIRNLIYRIGAGNNDYSGLAFKFNSGYDPSGPMFLFHNTVDAALPGSSGLDIKEPGEWALITARNNIWSGTNYALYNANPTQPLDLDYDDLHTTQAGELAWWDGLLDKHLNTLAELRAATGQELNGFNLAPGFAAPAAGDYTLANASPLIDKGAPLPGINAGYKGAAPDLGAFERQDSPARPHQLRIQ